MFPQNQSGPQTGSGFPTSTTLQQNTGLLGSPQIQSTAAPTFDAGSINTTAPQSTTNPAVASMVRALKGGM